MNFKKFIILDPKQTEPLMNNEITILMNLDHIVSIKPIRIVNNKKVIEGYWIRTTNNKKYKALSIPEELRAELEKNITIHYSTNNYEEEILNVHQ
ncbi:MAG: hypothetical protein JNM93_12180 [Bacteriovoracaceae bacterium]|nr:hypothetical protein [Bacteriovoracaceae bacterium]